MNFFQSIKTKLFFILLIITLIPVIINASISYNNYTTLISKQISQVSSNTLHNSVERFKNKLNAISNDSLTFAYQQSNLSNSVIDELKKYKNHVDNLNDDNLFTSRQNLAFFCYSFLYTHNYVNGIYIFTKGGNSLSYSKVNDLKVGYDPSGDDWYKKTLEQNSKLYISDVGKKDFIINAAPSISFSRALLDQDDGSFLGIIMLDCSLDIFNDLSKDILPNSTSIYLINESGKIIYDNSMSKIGLPFDKDVVNKVSGSLVGSFQSNQGKFLTVYESLSNYGWKAIEIISIDLLRKEFAATRMLIIYITLTSIIVFTILSMIVSNLLTRHITELSRIMRQNKSHQLVTTKKQLDRKDELGTLYNEYNNMINEINTFIKESYQNRIISLDSQMKALEAQVNSHFLYNTLGTINSFAEIEGSKSISIMSQALGDMFRYAIKTESELVVLDEELEHTNNYLAIQKIRFREKINFTYDIAENIKQEKILKLILQPLVENAFNHGFEGKEGLWELRIRGYYSDDSIILEVIDNGVGISPRQVCELEELLMQPPAFSDLGRRTKQSIGIKNVHSRIALYYGQQYGLTLESRVNVGTTVRIHVPRIKDSNH